MDKKTFLSTINLFFILNVLAAQDFKFELSPDGILLMESGDRVLFYQRNLKSEEGKYGRAHYFHPLYGLKGDILTKDVPPDHPHHRGVFWAWHELLLGGKKVADGWDIKNIEWIVNNTTSNTNEKYAILNTNVVWRILKDNGKALDIVEETCLVRVSQPHQRLRRMDFEIQLKALTDSVNIAGSQDEKGYGGFSIRLILPENVQFYDQQKLLIPKNEAVSGGDWLKVKGELGRVSAIPTQLILITHPEYPNKKQKWILRSKGSMQNVVFPGKNAVRIYEHEPLILKYGLILFNKNTPYKLVQNQIEKFQDLDTIRKE
ncbi:MAG TPA: hypothetical protein DDY13_14860 [Cytophagales bacterium]|jgi:hypothetical protein|nr:hypothetical protein [Cytophagales bacterium]